MSRLTMICLWAICSCNFVAVAQSNFVDGRIVTTAGDTIAAQINNRDWNRNPKSITAKNADGSIRTYAPMDIKGFYLTDSKEWYNGAIVTTDKSSIKSNEVLKNINLRGKDTDTIFLKVLVKGRLNLYSMVDEYSRRHYLSGKDGKIEELGFEKKRVLVPKEGVVVIEHYKNQLKNYVIDCKQPPVATKVQYAEKSLIDFVTTYNRCMSSEVGFVAVTERSEFRFSVLAGAHYTSLTYKVQDVTRKYDPSAGPVAGVALEVVFARNRRSLSLYNELVYKSYSVTFTNTTLNTTNTYDATQLKLFTGFRYRVPTDNAARLFFGLNVVNGLAVSHKVVTQGNKDFRTHEQGVAIDAGVQAGRFQYLVRYELANGFSPGPAVKTNFSGVYGTIAFALTK